MATRKMSSLEEDLTKLEELTKKLEENELSLDDAINSYSEGIKLIASCKKSLDDMQMRIEQARSEAQVMFSQNESKN